MLAYGGQEVGELDQADAEPKTSTSRMAYEDTSAASVASQPGQPCRRAAAPIGSTAIVSTSASIVGATIPAAPYRAIAPSAAPPMLRSTTVDRGSPLRGPPACAGALGSGVGVDTVGRIAILAPGLVAPRE